MMPDPLLGRYNTLRVIAHHDSGLLLDGGGIFGDVLLPKRYVTSNLCVGDEVEIFLSLDSEDRPVATTESPFAIAGEFAYLKVIDSTRAGLFLDWGLPKDLLLPFGEQPKRLRVGQFAVVYIYVDDVSGRLVASAKLKKFVAETAPLGVRGGNRVSIMVVEKTEIGTRAIINDSYWGMIKSAEEQSLPPIGSRCDGFISRIRLDGLVDLSLEPPGYSKVSGAAERLLDSLSAGKSGFIPLHDKSSPEQVRELLGMSKKVFKQAVGNLYKAHRIRIAEDGIYLCD